LDNAGSDYRTQSMVDGMYEDYRDDAEAGRKFIRDNARTEDRDKTLARWNTRMAQDEKAEKDAENDIFDQGQGTYLEGIEAGLTPQDAYDAVDREGMKGSHALKLYNAMQADARGSEYHSNPDDLLDLYEMATGTPEQKAQFRDKSKTNLRDYNLNPTHTLYYAKLQSDLDAVAIASTFADLKREVSTTMGLYDKDTGKRKDAEGILAVNKRFDDEMIALQAATGHTAKPVDGRAIADRLNLDFMRKSTFFGFSAGYDRVPVVGAKVEGVPDDLVDEIVYRLTATRRKDAATSSEEQLPVTEQDIKDYWVWRQRQNKGYVPSSRGATRGMSESEASSIPYYPDQGGHF